MMTKNKAVAAIIALVEKRDYVTFVEIGNAVPGFNRRRGEEGFMVGLHKSEGGMRVYWLMSDFGSEVFDAVKSKVAMMPAHPLTYVADGGWPQLKPPDEFFPVVLRPVRTTNFIAGDGSNIAVPADQWPTLRRSLGKEAAATGRAKAKAFVAALP